MIRYFCGMDPGLVGGFISIIKEDDETEEVTQCDKYPIPTKKAKGKGNEIDLEALSQLLIDIWDMYKPSFTVIEKLNVLGGGYSKGSSGKMLHALGKLHGYVHCRGWEHDNIRPPKWQKEIWEEDDKVIIRVQYQRGKKKGQWYTKTDTKPTTLAAAQRIFPDADFRKSDRAKKPFDGVYDSIAIAEYARRSYHKILKTDK